jgi:signal transduction histidine kinase
MSAQAAVLIVDDEPGVRESLRMTLASECVVHVAASGAEALAVIRSTPIDVVTLDLRMPGGDGIKVLERIKALDPSIEALIITGYASQESLDGGTRLAFDYVSKPFDVEHVRGLVRRAAAHRRAVAQMRQAKRRVLGHVTEALGESVQALVCEDEGAGRRREATSFTEAQRAMLDGIRDNSEALVRYLARVLLLTDLRTGDLPCVLREVSLARALAATLEPHRRRAAEKGVVLSFRDASPGAVRTDPELVARLVDALVDNAVKFTDTGEVLVSLTPVPASEGSGLTISVRDTGPGLDAAPTAPGAVGPATGLGLRIVEAIVTRLHARLEMSGPPGRGTEVRVTVPIEVCVPRAVEAPPAIPG